MNINSLKNLIKISFYVIIISITTSTLWCQTSKPDLIITNIKFKYVKPERSYVPGGPIQAIVIPPMPTFYVTVKNIGKSDFNSAFSISYATDNQDIKIGRYSHAMRVSDGKEIIKVDDSLVVMVGGDPSRYRKHYKFFIQTDGKAHYNDPLPLVEEENYENNTYEIDIPNYK